MGIYHDNTVLITGGSSGIGYELSKLFLKDGYQVLMVSLSKEELKAAKSQLEKSFSSASIITLQKDLTAENACQEVYDFTKANDIRIDVLVNNAGFGTWGFIPDIEVQKEQNMIRLNVLAVYTLTRLFLTDMIARDQGRIMNISSVSAFQPNPFLGTYGATKAFVHSFTRALRHELREQKSKVKVVTVCPTPVRTNFQKAAAMESSSLFSGWMSVEPDFVAKEAYKALRADREMTIPGWGYQALQNIVKHLPESLVIWMAKQNIKAQ